MDHFTLSSLSNYIVPSHLSIWMVDDDHDDRNWNCVHPSQSKWVSPTIETHTHIHVYRHACSIPSRWIQIDWPVWLPSQPEQPAYVRAEEPHDTVDEDNKRMHQETNEPTETRKQNNGQVCAGSYVQSNRRGLTDHEIRRMNIRSDLGASSENRP